MIGLAIGIEAHWWAQATTQIPTQSSDRTEECQDDR